MSNPLERSTPATDPSAQAAQATPWPAALDGPARVAGRWRTILSAVALVLMVLATYLPVLDGKFLWDDTENVVTNGALRSWDGLRQMWFVPRSSQQYYPLMYTSFWVEHQLWGLSSLGYHLDNVLLHAAAAVLVWRLLVRLQVPGAWLAAAIFAVHPVEVESVAWITERKNVLSLALALAAMLCYLRFAPPDEGDYPRDAGRALNHWRWYTAAFLLFALAMFAKTVVLSLPAVLLVIYWWKRSSIGGRDVLPLVPFFALGAGLALVTIWMETHHLQAQGDQWALSPVERLLLAGRELWFYAGKLAWPHPLAFFYPSWSIDARAPWQYLFAGAALAVPIMLCSARSRLGRGPLAGALVFAGVLLPALGFVNIYYTQFAQVSDHFQYHGSLALIASAAAGGTLAARRLPVEMRSVARCSAAALLIVLAILACRRALVFQDQEILYRDTIAKNPESVIAHTNLALYLYMVDPARYAEALDMAREAVRLAPGNAAAQNNLGYVLWQSGERFGYQPGQIKEAIRHLHECLRINPDDAAARGNLAFTMLADGRTDDALAQFTRVLHAEPSNASALYGMGACLQRQGQPSEALDYYARSIDNDPYLAPPRFALARSLVEQGNLDEAVRHLQAALGIDPANVDAHFLLASALLRRGDLHGASQHFGSVVRLRPNHVAALVNLAITLVNMHQTDRAIQYLDEALRQQPDSVNAHYALATALAQRGQVDDAVGQFRSVLQLDPQHAEAHCDLANLLVAAGDLRQAATHYALAARLRPTYVEAWQKLGAAELELGDAAEAVKHLQEAVRLQPDNAQARALLQQAQALAK